MQHLIKLIYHLPYNFKMTNIFFKLLYTKSWNNRFNVLIEGKMFFDEPVKIKEEKQEKKHWKR